MEAIPTSRRKENAGSWSEHAEQRHASSDEVVDRRYKLDDRIRVAGDGEQTTAVDALDNAGRADEAQLQPGS